MLSSALLNVLFSASFFLTAFYVAAFVEHIKKGVEISAANPQVNRLTHFPMHRAVSKYTHLHLHLCILPRQAHAILVIATIFWRRNEKTGTYFELIG